MQNGKCIKCDSEDLVPVTPRADGNSITVATYSNPTAWLFKGQKSRPVTGIACQSCGYLEFYLTNR